MKFRKKPVVIDAEQWAPGKEIDGVCFKVDTGASPYVGGLDQPHIHTLKGIFRVSDGDWIIKGVKGEFSLCKPDIFELTYEQVEVNLCQCDHTRAIRVDGEDICSSCWLPVNK